MRGRGVRLLAVLALAAVLGGCRTSRVIKDEEIKKNGEWTEADEQARRILDDMGGAWRPVRLPTVAEKLGRVGLDEGGIELGAVSTLLGLDYDTRYYYSDKAKCYVLLSRGKPPVIVDDADPQKKTFPTDDRRERRESELARRIGERLSPPVSLPEPERFPDPLVGP